MTKQNSHKNLATNLNENKNKQITIKKSYSKKKDLSFNLTKMHNKRNLFKRINNTYKILSNQSIYSKNQPYQAKHQTSKEYTNLKQKTKPTQSSVSSIIEVNKKTKQNQKTITKQRLQNNFSTQVIQNKQKVVKEKQNGTHKNQQSTMCQIPSRWRQSIIRYYQAKRNQSAPSKNYLFKIEENMGQNLQNTKSQAFKNQNVKSNQIQQTNYQFSKKNQAQVNQEEVQIIYLQSDDESSSLNSIEYKVEKIVSSKIKDGTTFYQIKWAGYPSSQNTYQPIKNLQNVLQMVIAFENAQKTKFKQLLNKKQRLLQEKNKNLLEKIQQISQKNIKIEEIYKTIQNLKIRIRQLQKGKKQTDENFDRKILKTHQSLKFQIEQQSKHKKALNLRSNRLNQKEERKKKDQIYIKIDTKLFDQYKYEFILSQQDQKKSLWSKDTIDTKSIQSLELSQRNLQSSIQVQNVAENNYVFKKQNQANNVKIQEKIDFFQSNPIFIKSHQSDQPFVHSDQLSFHEDHLMPKQSHHSSIIYQDLELIQYSFPSIGAKINYSNIFSNFIGGNQSLTNNNQLNLENQMENHSLIQEFDCLKYFSAE